MHFRVLKVALMGGQRVYSPILWNPRTTSFDLRVNLIAHDLASSCKSLDVHCLFCQFVVLWHHYRAEKSSSCSASGGHLLHRQLNLFLLVLLLVMQDVENRGGIAMMSLLNGRIFLIGKETMNTFWLAIVELRTPSDGLWRQLGNFTMRPVGAALTMSIPAISVTYIVCLLQ